MNQFNYPATF